MELDPQHYLKHSKIQLKSASEVIAQMALKQGMRLLDVGCGDGKITAFLQELTGEAVGVDQSENMIRFASTQFPHVHFEQQKAEEMRFDKPFDILTCLNALHWVRQPELAFARMHAALKPRGKAYILTFPRESIYWQPLQKTAQNPLFEPYRKTAAQIYSAEEYHRMAERAGFEIVSSQLQEEYAVHPTVEDLKAYIQGWLPSYIDLPDHLQKPSIDLAAQYQTEQSVDKGDGAFHLPFTKLVLVLQSKST